MEPNRESSSGHGVVGCRLSHCLSRNQSRFSACGYEGNVAITTCRCDIISAKIRKLIEVAMITPDDVLKSIKPRIRDSAQEARIRRLYDRTSTAFDKDRIQGIEKELESDWAQLKANFDRAIAKVKKDTGLF